MHSHVQGQQLSAVGAPSRPLFVHAKYAPANLGTYLLIALIGPRLIRLSMIGPRTESIAFFPRLSALPPVSDAPPGFTDLEQGLSPS